MICNNIDVWTYLHQSLYINYNIFTSFTSFFINIYLFILETLLDHVICLLINIILHFYQKKLCHEYFTNHIRPKSFNFYQFVCI